MTLPGITGADGGDGGDVAPKNAVIAKSGTVAATCRMSLPVRLATHDGAGNVEATAIKSDEAIDATHVGAATVADMIAESPSMS